MGTQTRDSQAMVDAAVSSISHLATLPELTMRVIELVESPSSSAQDLHNVIARDPALCSRILKIVNSAFYGLQRQVTTIERAISLLGLNAVKNIAIASSLTKLQRGGELCEAFSARQLWTHSFAVASASKIIAEELKWDTAEEAFLAGLMHDIGIMVEMQMHHDGLMQVFDRMRYDESGLPQTDMREIEREVLGADHEVYGRALCESWKFPTSLVHTAGHHHEPLTSPQEHRALACVVYVADRLAITHDIGFHGDLTTHEISHDVLDVLHLSVSQINHLGDTLQELRADAETTLH